jgi:hypothetical protein
MTEPRPNPTEKTDRTPPASSEHQVIEALRDEMKEGSLMVRQFTAQQWTATGGLLAGALALATLAVGAEAWEFRVFAFFASFVVMAGTSQLVVYFQACILSAERRYAIAADQLRKLAASDVTFWRSIEDIKRPFFGSFRTRTMNKFVSSVGGGVFMAAALVAGCLSIRPVPTQAKWMLVGLSILVAASVAGYALYAYNTAMKDILSSPTSKTDRQTGNP